MSVAPNRRATHRRRAAPAPTPDPLAGARLRPRLTMLDGQACLRLHAASCRILDETGVRVYSPDAVSYTHLTLPTNREV